MASYIVIFKKADKSLSLAETTLPGKKSFFKDKKRNLILAIRQDLKEKSFRQ